MSREAVGEPEPFVASRFGHLLAFADDAAKVGEELPVLGLGEDLAGLWHFGPAGRYWQKKQAKSLVVQIDGEQVTAEGAFRR
ncbi:MAG: hypothetical protein WCE62_00145 [Polyangiales bacterium]